MKIPRGYVAYVYTKNGHAFVRLYREYTPIERAYYRYKRKLETAKKVLRYFLSPSHRRKMKAYRLARIVTAEYAKIYGLPNGDA